MEKDFVIILEKSHEMYYLKTHFCTNKHFFERLLIKPHGSRYIVCDVRVAHKHHLRAPAANNPLLGHRY